MLAWDFNRRWRTILWLLVGIGMVLFVLMAWDGARWRRIDSESGAAVWQRGTVTHTDENHDGVIDEVSRRTGENSWLIQRDSDADGVLDLEYKLVNGIATHLRTIKETAPRRGAEVRSSAPH
jgi:hypothetical protein